MMERLRSFFMIYRNISEGFVYKSDNKETKREKCIRISYRKFPIFYRHVCLISLATTDLLTQYS
jgi:hypothetical protein